jgi:hypothetical protein
MYASSQYINIIGISQKLVCTIQLQAILVYLNHPNGILQGKVEKQWRQSISLFQTIPYRKHVRQILAAVGSTGVKYNVKGIKERDVTDC